MTTQTFRDTLRKISPPWLQRGLAEKIGYAIAVQIDAISDVATAGVFARYPGLGTPTALQLIGRERRIRRGRLETDASYAGRLRRWLVDHPRRGGPYALLEQLRAYFSAAPFPIHLASISGVRYVLDVDGAITRDVPAVRNKARWARWVLLYFTDSLDEMDLDELQLVPREWIAAHVGGDLIVMHTGVELWNYPPERPWNNPGVWNKPAAPRVEIA